MSENGEIYTAGKNTLPLAVTAWTNLTSAISQMLVWSVGGTFSSKV